jgi:hypothetical protein
MEETDAIELRCLLDEPSVLRDQLFIDILISRKQVSLQLLLKRIAYLKQLFPINFIDLKTYRQYEKQFVYRIREIDIPTRKPKKYSGWVRNSSAVGSKRSGPRRELIPSFNVEENVQDFSFLEFLTVGELMGRSVSLKHSDDESKKIRNGKPSTK